MSKLLDSGMMPGGDYFARKMRERMEESKKAFDAFPIEERISRYEESLRNFWNSEILQDTCIQLAEKIIEWRTEKIKRDYCE